MSKEFAAGLRPFARTASRFQSASELGNASLPGSKQKCEQRFGWSFHLSQFEVHSVQRVALNAAQLRRFGAAEPLNTRTCEAPERATNHLPVNPPAKSTKLLSKLWSALAQRSSDRALDSARMRIQVQSYATTKSSVPASLRFAGALQKKENQCQES